MPCRVEFPKYGAAINEGTAAHEIIIETSPPAVHALFESKSISSGMTRTIPGVGTLRLEPTFATRSLGEPIFLTVVCWIAKEVATPLAVMWFYDRLKTKNVTRVRMNRIEIDVTPEEITRVITESMEVEEPVS